MSEGTATAATTPPATARRRKVETKAHVNGAKTQGKHADTHQPRSFAFLLVKWLVVALLAAFGVGQFIAGDVLWGYRGKYTKVETYVPPTRIFTPEELWQYNGQNQDLPILVSILGNVYDVTPGRWIYGPRGSYRFFAGRDASRAFVTGCFETHLTHDLRGLSKDEIEGIHSWKEFYDEHGAYHFVGKLQLPPIDPKSPIPEPCNTASEDTNERAADAQKPV